MSPSADEFARWRDDTVTRWVMAAHRRIAADAKQAWIEASWTGGQANPLFLKEMRVMADSYEAIIETPYEAYVETNGDEAIYDAD